MIHLYIDINFCIKPSTQCFVVFSREILNNWNFYRTCYPPNLTCVQGQGPLDPYTYWIVTSGRGWDSRESQWQLLLLLITASSQWLFSYDCVSGATVSPEHRSSHLMSTAILEDLHLEAGAKEIVLVQVKSKAERQRGTLLKACYIAASAYFLSDFL